MTASKTLRYGRFINRLIRFFNKRLPGSDQLPYLPIVPFHANGTLEEVVWRYYNLILDGYADWHDDGSAREGKIIAAKRAIEKEWGERLREYLKPYEGVDHSTVSSLEYHRARVATELFGA